MKKAKTIISILLTVALIACIGVCAFAAAPEAGNEKGGNAPDRYGSSGMFENGCDSEFCPKNGQFPGYGYPPSEDFGDEFGGDFDPFEDAYDEYSFFLDEDFDIDEFLAGIEDESLKAEIKKLYEDYIAKYNKAIEAEDAFYDAEDALFDAIDKLELSNTTDSGDVNPVPQDNNSQDKGNNTPDAESKNSSDSVFDYFGMTEEDFEKFFNEFMSWFSSYSNSNV